MQWSPLPPQKKVRLLVVSQRGCYVIFDLTFAGMNVFGGHNIQPQRTLYGKSISAVWSPKQVYRALGMHRGVSKQVERSWNHTFTDPVHAMSTRNRNRLLQIATPVVEKILQAFAGQHWNSLLYYISNNVVLHDRVSTRTNKADRVKQHRDLVYQETLIRSQLVKHVVNGFNTVEGTYYSLGYHKESVLDMNSLGYHEESFIYPVSHKVIPDERGTSAADYCR